MYADSYKRKSVIGRLVNFLMNSVAVKRCDFDHMLFKYRLEFSEEVERFAEHLKKKVTYKLVVGKPKLQMLEVKGQRIISALYDELVLNPSQLIHSWTDYDGDDSKERRVCDYIAGMTDTYAVKIYERLFVPGIGTSTDEL